MVAEKGRVAIVTGASVFYFRSLEHDAADIADIGIVGYGVSIIT
jgi:tRNA A37 N6-isopentenylltransferase MiaA